MHYLLTTLKPLVIINIHVSTINNKSLKKPPHSKFHQCEISLLQMRTRYGYGSGSGYLSEPEHRLYSDRSATFDSRRRLRNKENDFSTSTMPRNRCTLRVINHESDKFTNNKKEIALFLKILHFYFRNGALRYTPEVYKNQPGRIEDYEPGRSSIAEKEAKEFNSMKIILQSTNTFLDYLTEKG
ncbi:hypothetical protein E2986_12828 [Frieseomelitta varia]|uniref:Uncharacterized protein n=1 Tax=Frieseomelitta varia TaxID=561572 RepID=A0A833W4K4_9HYME|nr:hypothetical protein E2986_12828 [Frieseomelitta varia]